VPSKRSIVVCLISSHAYFLSDFQQKLVRAGFQVHTVRVRSTISADEQLTLPPASVFAVDALAHRQLTEMLISAILARRPKARIIVLAEKFTETHASPLLELGVRGIIQYADIAQLPRGLEYVACGGYWVPRAVLSQFVERILNHDLGRRNLLKTAAAISRREQSVLEALLENLSNKEIGNRLNISERTVKFHVSNLLSKYGVQRRADLILLSFQDQQVASRRVQ
jgi:DNA-binding NarL/FixJ family response regulator